MSLSRVRFTLLKEAAVFAAMLIVAFSFAVSVPQTAQAQTYKVIHNFTNQGDDGATPYGGPILDKDGNLYGTTYLGGTFGAGSVYKLSTDGSSWTYTSLYSLKASPDGSGPAFGSLAVSPKGTMVATTEGGGFFGTAFAICARPTCSWRENVLHSFGTGTDGAQPIGGVVIDAGGNIYGTTSLGGASGNGTVYEIGPSGTYKTLYSFGPSPDAINPPSEPTLGPDGSLYGTSSLGAGEFGFGAVYKLTRTGSGWAEHILYNFTGSDDGEYPVGGVILDRKGNIYGTTFSGGVNGGGIVYKLSPGSNGHNFTVLYSFTGSFSGPYNKLIFDSQENLYGTTNGGGPTLGSVFKLTRNNDTWTYTDLYDFVGGDTGGLPYGAVAVDAQGNVFGTAVVGGSDNQGIVFEITP